MASSGTEPIAKVYGWTDGDQAPGNEDRGNSGDIRGASSPPQSDTLQGRNGREDRRFLLVGLFLLLVILVTGIVLIYLSLTYDNGPYMELKCDLPFEQPSMKVLLIVPTSINNTTEAQAYAGRFFPQFGGVEFSERDDYFHGEIHVGFFDEYVSVYRDGVIDYNNNLESIDVSPDAFPIDTIRNLSRDFITMHGGMGQYEETGITTGKVTYSNDPATYLRDCIIEYHMRYDGHLILGYDRIYTVATANNGTVWSYRRSVYPIEATNETRQVITAAAAYHALFKALDGGDSMHRITVTSVDLCYYVVDTLDEKPVIYAAWHFVGSDLDFFIDAFTGENLSGWLL